jgi:hypothetical protein
MVDMEETNETKFRNRLKDGEFHKIQAKQLLDWGFKVVCICGKTTDSWEEFEQHLNDSIVYYDKLEAGSSINKS